MGLHLFLLRTSNVEQELDKVESLIKQQLSASEQLIPANLDFITELNELINKKSNTQSYEALKLNIYGSDTLLYWNHPTIIDTSSKDSPFLQVDEGENYTIIRDLNLFDEEGLFSNNIITRAGSEYQFQQASAEESTHEIVLHGLPIYLKKSHIVKKEWKSVLCFSLLLLCLSLFLLWHNLFSRSVLNVRNSLKGLAASIGILIAGRLLLGQIDFYQFYNLEQIFNPSFNFSPIHSSVGSMLWNSSFLFAGAISISQYLPERPENKITTIVGSILSLSFPILLLIVFVYLTQGLIYTTDIIIDNYQIISFDKHSIAELFSLVLILISAFFLHYSAVERISKWKLSNQKKLGATIAAFGLSIPAYMMLVSFPSMWLFYGTIAAFYLVQDLFMDNKLKNLPWAIWWMVLYAGFTAALVFGLSFQKRIAERSDFISQVYIEDNNRTNKEIEGIKDSILTSGIIKIISTLPYPAKFEKPDIIEYLKSNLSESQIDYLDEDFEVYIYDGYANSYFDNDFRREDEIVSDISIGKQTHPGIYYIPFKQKYIIDFFTQNENYPGSRLRIYFGLKAKSNSLKKDVNTDYIVYQNNRTLKESNSSAASFEPFINFADGQYFFDRKSIIVKEKSDGIKIISVEKIANLLKPISIFSFFFLFIGILLFLITLLNSVYSFLPESLNLKFKKANSLRSRLQLMVILLIIISFLFIGFVSFYYFKNILESNQNQEFVRDLEKIQKDIYATNKDALDDQGSLIILSNSLLELSEIHNVDISLYDRNAVLVNTINPDKKPNLKFEAAQLFFNNYRLNTINTFENSEYASFIALKRLNPMIYGFVEVNHRTTGAITDRLKEFINTILNLYVFLFLLAGAIAISVANSITYPLTALSEKLKQTKLGRKNEQLQWESRDEIGVLIQEYNSMISKLEESATLLAKTERDHAWKEMAKQVAHEVKNPLTPMKLSVQSLDRAISADPDNAKAIIKKTTKTLVEQIDTLTEIANSFANLAKMPKASNERIVLNTVVESVHDLFEGRDDFQFQLILPMDDLNIYADRNQLVRILNNLIKNAAQAIPSDRNGKIVMELSQKEQNALIRLSDNGSGIKEEMRDKIFTPNFTTKSTGTGIGLAMCANMIETLSGKIYFDSEINVGTDFYIEIPLMKAAI